MIVHPVVEPMGRYAALNIIELRTWVDSSVHAIATPHDKL